MDSKRYKCYGTELLYPIDDDTVIGYQEYQIVNGVKEKADAILLVRAIVRDGKAVLIYSDPDGTEREEWLKKIGRR